MKYLFEIITGEVGESYIRAYAWAENEYFAVLLADKANPGIFSYPIETKRLFPEDSECFATKLSDSGFESLSTASQPKTPSPDATPEPLADSPGDSTTA